MQVPNPEYNKDWKEVYDHHEAELLALQEEIRRCAQDSDKLEELRRRADFHHKAGLDSFRMQHPTIQGYAAWLFETFPPGHAYESNTIIMLPDFESFKTLDEVNDEWGRINNDAKSAYSEYANALPTGEPVEAFAKKDCSNIFSRWRFFDSNTLFTNGYGGACVNALVSAQQIGDQFHVCFMEDHQYHGASTVNSIELLANVIYRETLQIAQKQKERKPRAVSLSQSLREFFPGSKPENKTIHPSDFHFYIHIPPKTDIREAFIEVKLSHDPKRGYHSPEWTRHDRIPEVIQGARDELLKPVTPMLSKLLSYE